MVCNKIGGRLVKTIIQPHLNTIFLKRIIKKQIKDKPKKKNKSFIPNNKFFKKTK